MIPTVKVKTDAPDNEQGFYLLNEHDFDPKVHELFDEDKKVDSKPKRKKAAE